MAGFRVDECGTKDMVVFIIIQNNIDNPAKKPRIEKRILTGERFLRMS